VRRRLAGTDAGWAARSAFTEVAMIVGTLPWIWLILTPNPGHSRGKSLVPFRDLVDQFHVGLGYASIQIGGNLVVFAALGFCLPIRFRVGPATSLGVGAVLSVTVESLQWYLHLGRFTSVDDVIVNATGAFVFAWLSRPWWRRRARAMPPVTVPARAGAAPGAARLPGRGD
jgi:glycopeptide antibiotics resistance protein